MRIVGIVTLVCICFASQVAAAELGRLFFSPRERIVLERLRHQQPDAAVEAAAAEANELPEIVLEPTAEPLVTETLKVNGYVRRSSGPATVWVNDINSYGGNFGELGLDGRAVRLQERKVLLPIGREQQAISLKPGQTFDPVDDTISEAYERAPAMRDSE